MLDPASRQQEQQSPYRPPNGAYPQRSPNQIPEPFYPPVMGRPRPGTPFLALAILLAVLLAGGITVAAFRNEILLRVSPETYLLRALSKTIGNVLDTPSPLPSLDKFAGRPVSRELHVQIGDTGGAPFYGMPENASFGVTAKTDWQNGRVMLGFSMSSGLFSMPDNRIYLSPETVGVSLPSVLGEYGFMTADTGTLARDWNRSRFAQETYWFVPEYLNFEDSLATFFQTMRMADAQAAIPLSGRLEADVRRMLEAMPEKMQIRHMGDILPDFSDGERYERFVCTVPGKEAEAFLRGLTAAFLGEYQAGTGGFLTEGTAWAMQYAMFILDGLEFGGDLELEFYISRDGRVEAASLSEISYEIPYDSGDVSEYAFSAELLLRGDKNLCDDLLLSLSHEDTEYNDAYEITITRAGTDTNGEAHTRWELTAANRYMGYSLDAVTFTYDFGWQRGSQTSDNMRVALEMRTGYGGGMLEITGNLIDSDQMVALSDGRISVITDDETLGGLSFSCKIQPASVSDMSLEAVRTTDFFSIPYDELEEALTGSFSMPLNAPPRPGRRS